MRASLASLPRASAAVRVRSLCTSSARPVLIAHKRGPELQGTGAAHWLRKQGRTPGCLIGDRLPQLPFWVEATALEVLMRPRGFGSRLIDLDFDGEIVRALPAEVSCGAQRPAPARREQ
jgi:ribosomal protein L25 (general stress protein Ctc)